MKKTNDRKVMAVLTAAAVISGSVLAGGITGYHQSDTVFEEFNAKSHLEKERAKQNKNFWNLMRIAADVTAVCAGYASGLLIQEAFNIGKKH